MHIFVVSFYSVKYMNKNIYILYKNVVGFLSLKRSITAQWEFQEKKNSQKNLYSTMSRGTRIRIIHLHAHKTQRIDVACNWAPAIKS